MTSYTKAKIILAIVPFQTDHHNACLLHCQSSYAPGVKLNLSAKGTKFSDFKGVIPAYLGSTSTTLYSLCNTC